MNRMVFYRRLGVSALILLTACATQLESIPEDPIPPPLRGGNDEGGGDSSNGGEVGEGGPGTGQSRVGGGAEYQATTAVLASGGGGAEYQGCIRACKGGVDQIAAFCRQLPPGIPKGGCYALAFGTTAACLGWCYNYFGR